MGSGSWSKNAYADISMKRSSMSRDMNFTQSREGKSHKNLSPIGVDIRESRDSDAHPESIAIIVALDVTGSMGSIPERMIKEKLGALMNTLIDNGIMHPQIMFMAVGDHISDAYPLQVGQFESGTTEIDDCLSKIYIEGGGGGDGHESYPLAWYFAAMHTSIDCFEKRAEKGFIFTIGDEGFHQKMEAGILQSKVGYNGGEDLTASALYDLASHSYNIFHIHALQGSNGSDRGIMKQWTDLINERFLKLDNQDLIAELIATTVAMVHGVHLEQAMSSFDDKTKASISGALVAVKDSIVKKESKGSGVVAI